MKRRRFWARNWKRFAIFLCLLIIIAAVIKRDDKVLDESKLNAARPELNVRLLTVNPYSRPGTELKQINGIVIHYTANPGSTAAQNRDYFENLKDTHDNQVSSHFVVGLDGEIIQCIPSWEVAYASNERNMDTISIECCHPDETGELTTETYQSVVNLTAWLCLKFNLEADQVIRHYDVTGKICPKYFVEDENAWNEFKEYVQKAMDKEL